MKPDHRSKPPLPVKRQLRQEAGFGCCKCGFPIVEYHHIVAWADEKHYRPDDMMILCDRCHGEVTNGKVPEAEQRRWKANPVNIANDHTAGLLRVNQQSLAVDFGHNMIRDCPTLLRVHGVDLMSMRISEYGNLEISVKCFDDNNNTILEIENNEWITGQGLPWDLEARWQHIILRHKLRDIGFEIDAREDLLKVRGKLSRDGIVFFVRDDHIITSTGQRLQNVWIENCDVGINY